MSSEAQMTSKGKTVQGRCWQLPGSALPVLSSQMLRTQWVLNWPGQVTIAGCQTYWTLEVEEALEAGNLSSRLFPQLARQVRLKAGRGVTICSPPTPHTLRQLSPSRSFVMS